MGLSSRGVITSVPSLDRALSHGSTEMQRGRRFPAAAPRQGTVNGLASLPQPPWPLSSYAALAKSLIFSKPQFCVMRMKTQSALLRVCFWEAN